MLAKLSSRLWEAPEFSASVSSPCGTRFVAFPLKKISTSETLTLTCTAARGTGVCGLVLRLFYEAPDAPPETISTREVLFAFSDSKEGKDIYTLTISPCDLVPEGIDVEEGSFLTYQIELNLGKEKLFLCMDADGLCYHRHPRTPFSLLRYQGEFDTPAWAKEGLMYHIFVDRFCRGAGEVSFAETATIDEDWNNGVPQYGAYPGAPVTNTVFFGGNLWGIIEKLDYLESLGVTILYLSPIFTARSNHKYDTGDYGQVDGGFGGDAALDALLCAAHKRGMRVVLDGVFNHTGDDSRYFNRYGRYPEVGAYQSRTSPYSDWYHFSEFPDKYESWWGISILPRVDTSAPGCVDYFLNPKTGIVPHYLEKGIDGWRLDVADEVNSTFLTRLRTVAKEAKSDALIVGEVWENAAEKLSYGCRRRYLQGGQLDSVMNYPFRSAVLNYLSTADAKALADALTALYGAYPRCVCDALMNLLGTHDTDRIATVLGGESANGISNAVLARKRMTPSQKEKSQKLQRLGAVLQYTVYGFPSVFYGDEIGMEGYHDPFCRFPFPWGKEECEMLTHYRRLGKIRRSSPALRGGSFEILFTEGGKLIYRRSKGKQELVALVFRGGETPSAALSEYCTALARKGYTDLYREIPWDGTLPAGDDFLLLGR